MNDAEAILDMIADDLIETTYNHLKGPSENDPEAVQFYKIANRIREAKERVNDKSIPLGEWTVRDAISRGKSIQLPEPDPTHCYICGVNFKPEDWSTYITIDGELEFALVHDDCLEILAVKGMWSKKPLKELGHKIWGDEQ